MVEWGRGGEAAAHFVRRYSQLSGDDPARRLRPFLLAYSVFRLGHCKMGAEAMRDSDEAPRLLRAYQHYRQQAAALLAQTSHPATTLGPTPQAPHPLTIGSGAAGAENPA